MEAIAELLNLPMILSSLVGFVIFFLVLKKFMWQPVLGVIDQRRESIEQAFQEVDDARAEVEKLKHEYEAHLEKINAEAQEQVQAAIEQGKRAAEEIRAEADKQREKMLERTHEEIQREKDKAVAELRNQAIDLSYEISNRVTRQQLDRGKHDQLVASFIDDLKGLN